MIRKIISVKGRVQGVFFRQSAKVVAEKLNVCGFARNMDDGTVFIEAEGAEGDVEAFVRWCKEGSSLAIVEALDIRQAESPAEYPDFKIF